LRAVAASADSPWRNYLPRAQDAGLTCWPLPANLKENQLERLLFPLPPGLTAQQRGIPYWLTIHEELKRKHGTLFLLWLEYCEANPDGCQYSWFCEHYGAWRGKMVVVMRQHEKAGETLFVHYASQTVPVTDRATGEFCEAQIFVAVLGASN